MIELRDQQPFIDLSPPYQRQGNLWSLAQRQLLIDSVLNDFNIPEIYLHQFPTPEERDGKKLSAAVIDGKQRLESIWRFMDGEYGLADDFVFLDDLSIDAAHATYPDLARQFPLLRARFDSTRLAITAVHTSDIDLLEDLFTRLNTQTDLTSGEKRNALGGAIPPILRRIAQHGFFRESVDFDTGRYRDRDLAAKFVYIVSKGSIVSTKKRELDEFVLIHRAKRRPFMSTNDQEASLKEFQDKKSEFEAAARALETQVNSILERMQEFFRRRSSALQGQGVTILWFQLFRLLGQNPVPRGLTPGVLTSFLEDVRATDRKQRAMAQGSGEHLTAREQRLAEFLRHSQSPNDAYAIASRYRVLREDLREQHQIEIPNTD
jgi:hypothetical protein